MNLDVSIELGIAKELLASVDSVHFNLSNHGDWERVRVLLVKQIHRLDLMDRTLIALEPGRIVPFPSPVKNPAERRGRPRFHPVVS